MKQRPIQYRQGDVFLVEVPAAPAGSPVEPEHGRVILAHGELTGHHHSVDAVLARMIDGSDGERYLAVAGATPLTHQEHAPIDLLPGTYRVVRQREYSPEEVRFVAD